MAARVPPLAPPFFVSDEGAISMVFSGKPKASSLVDALALSLEERSMHWTALGLVGKQLDTLESCGRQLETMDPALPADALIMSLKRSALMALHNTTEIESKLGLSLQGMTNALADYPQFLAIVEFSVRFVQRKAQFVIDMYPDVLQKLDSFGVSASGPKLGNAGPSSRSDKEAISKVFREHLWKTKAAAASPEDAMALYVEEETMHDRALTLVLEHLCTLERCRLQLDKMDPALPGNVAEMANEAYGNATEIQSKLGLSFQEMTNALADYPWLLGILEVSVRLVQGRAQALMDMSLDVLQKRGSFRSSTSGLGNAGPGSGARA